MNSFKSGFDDLRAKIERGGFLTKWKGRVASVAPGASVIALSVALVAPANAQEVTGTISGGTFFGFVQNGDPVTLNGASSSNLTNTGGLTTDTAQVNDTLNVDGATTLNDTLDVTGNSVFSGSVDIAGPTTITDTLDVQVDDTALAVNGGGFNLQVGAGPNSTLDVTSTSVQLSAAGGSGFTASSGNASVTGTTTAVVSGGTSAITVSNSGVALSGSGGAPVVLSGVADPVSGTDAVNLRTLQRELGSLESEMSAGIAQSMAMTQLPYPDPDKQYSFGIALGGFNGEAGLAMGGAARLEGNTMLRGAVSYSDAGGLGAAAGIGWSW